MTSTIEKKEDTFGNVEDENLDRRIAQYINLYRTIKREYDQKGELFFDNNDLKLFLPEYPDEKLKSRDVMDYLKSLKEKIEQMLSKYSDVNLKTFIKTIGAYPEDENLPSAETAYKNLLSLLDPNTDISNTMVYLKQFITSNDTTDIGGIVNRIVLFRDAVINDYLKSLNAPPVPPPAPPLSISMKTGASLNVPPLS